MNIRRLLFNFLSRSTAVLHPAMEWLRRLRTYRGLFHLRDAVKAANAEKRKGGTVTLKLRGNGIPITLRCGSCDFIVLRKIFTEREYALPFAVDAKSIVDAGANIGLSALYLALEHPDASILAIEPDRANYDLLCSNTRQMPNVRPIHAALWSRPARLVLTNAGDEPWAYRFVETEGGEYDTVTMEEIIRQCGGRGIDVLKLDIEGGERELFEDEHSDRWLDQVKVMVVELHDRYLEDCSSTLVRRLAGRRFQCHVRGESLYLYLQHGDEKTRWREI